MTANFKIGALLAVAVLMLGARENLSTFKKLTNFFKHFAQKTKLGNTVKI